jgi:hypothetical protein
MPWARGMTGSRDGYRARPRDCCQDTSIPSHCYEQSRLRGASDLKWSSNVSWPWPKCAFLVADLSQQLAESMASDYVKTIVADAYATSVFESFWSFCMDLLVNKLRPQCIATAVGHTWHTWHTWPDIPDIPYSASSLYATFRMEVHPRKCVYRSAILSAYKTWVRTHNF